ncbi:8082_t:CDS:10 [Cetraspora pellucida]|uniref:8082_t:CDS:1 n=1 Tax=Cetraspora pellucida TaxID=1433469 RepID=A0ACA9K4P5_9GLOM|nr:8082_t:CDS:10 [Cetraspora pellucida]
MDQHILEEDIVISELFDDEDEVDYEPDEDTYSQKPNTAQKLSGAVEEKETKEVEIPNGNSSRHRPRSKTEGNYSDTQCTSNGKSNGNEKSDINDNDSIKDVKHSGVTHQDTRKISIKSSAYTMMRPSTSIGRPKKINWSNREFHHRRLTSTSSNGYAVNHHYKIQKSRSGKLNERDSNISRYYISHSRRMENGGSKSDKKIKGHSHRDDTPRERNFDTSTHTSDYHHTPKPITDNYDKEPRSKRQSDTPYCTGESRNETVKNSSDITRYFIMKSHNHENVQKSQIDGVWATQPINASVLSDAFRNSKRVVLIFSVNNSRHFQGFCLMESDVGTIKHASWTDISGSSLGGNFSVRWLKIGNLSFERTHNIRNPWNDNKPVKISRDGQELPESIGDELCSLFDYTSAKMDPVLDVNVDKNKSYKESPRRLEPGSGGIDRYRPYSTPSTSRTDRLRDRSQLDSLEFNRMRLNRNMHLGEHDRFMSHSGHFDSPYEPVPPFYRPSDAWQRPLGSQSSYAHRNHTNYYGRSSGFDREFR